MRGAHAAWTLLLPVAALAACTADAPDDPPASASVVQQVRWWSSGADPAGSAIRSDDAETAPDRLSPDPVLYCEALSATTQVGDSIVPSDVDVSDPGYQIVQRTFFAELGALAPAELADDWRSVAAVLQALIDGSSPTPAGPSDDGLPAVGDALAAIEEHAVTGCGLSAPVR